MSGAMMLVDFTKTFDMIEFEFIKNGFGSI